MGVEMFVRFGFPVAIIWIFALAAGLPTVVKAASDEKITFESATPRLPGDVLAGMNDAPKVKGYGILRFPSDYDVARGPVPVMFLVHGSAGIRKETTGVFGDMLLDMGVATFEVHAFGARGVKDQSSGYGKVSVAAAAVDAIRALDKLAADPRIAADRIGIMGWSFGGSAAALTHNSLFRSRASSGSQNFALHVGYYPWCWLHEAAVGTAAPLLILTGEKDDWTPALLCQKYLKSLAANGATTEIVVYPNTYHGFVVKKGKRYVKDGAGANPDCLITITRDGHSVFQRGTANEVDITAAGGWRGIDKKSPAGKAAFKACWKVGTTVAYNKSAMADSSLRLKEAVQRYILAGAN